MHHPSITVLITGGSGLIGQKLTSYLLKSHFKIIILSRKPRSSSEHVRYVLWNPAENYIDPDCPLPDVIINIAGENVGDGRWSPKKKEAILNSRLQATLTLKKWIEETKAFKPELYIGASATGFYGDRGQELLAEDAAPGNDFLASVCRQWEACHSTLESLVKRYCIIRLGIVLDREEGAFPKLFTGSMFGVLTMAGSGKQFMPWIHIEDVCLVISTLILDSNYSGVINVVSQEEAQAQTVVKILSDHLKGIWGVIHVPAWLLKITLGERSTLLLGSQRVFPDRLVSNGFVYQYPDVSSAVRNLVNH